MNELSEQNTAAKNNDKSFFESKRNKWLVAAGVVILLFAGLWIWKAIQISNLKEENAKQQEATKQQANEMIASANTRYLKLLAKPYVWAIRAEMMKGNVEAVNLYAIDMVKEKNFRTITVVDDKGTVISSTDKKLEGKPYTYMGEASHLNADSTIVDKQGDDVFNVVSPVMGFNKRMGTLVITYLPEKPTW